MPLLSDVLVIATAILVVMAPMTASFLQCWADRARNGPTHMPNGRSYCDNCGKTLSALDLVPILSWLWNRGKARCCGHSLAPALLWPEVAALTCAVWAAWVSHIPLAVVSVALVWTLQAVILLHQTRPDVARGFIAVLALIGLGLAAGGLTGALWSHLAGFGAGLAAAAFSRVAAPLKPYQDAAMLLMASGAILGLSLLWFSLIVSAPLTVAFWTFAPKLGLPKPNWPHAAVFGTAAGLWLTWLYGLTV